MLPMKKFKVEESDYVDNLDVQEKKKETLSVDEMKSVMNDIKKMSNSSNIKPVMGTLNYSRKREKFNEKVTKILKKLDSIDISDADDEIKTIFLFVLQASSDYLDNGLETDKMLINILKRFVNNDEFITKNIISIVKEKVKKMSLYRRYKKRVFNGCSFFLEWLFKIN